MKIYTEVLPKELLNLCREDVIKNQHEHIWASSSLRWSSDLLNNVDGTCLSTSIENKKIVYSLTEELLIAFENYDFDDLIFQYYIWDSYSAISPHNDTLYKFGATLYLNSNDICDGGLFVWQDEECPENFYRCLHPQENMMVVNDSKQTHFVTPISPHSKEYRYTIQIWGN